MLIRVGSSHSGIKEYLEKGQKQDRFFSRDELDERVIIAGNLTQTNAIINSISEDKESRYFHYTMSFKEQYIAPEILQEITLEFKQFINAAYLENELEFYAEAHLPKVRSYEDSNGNHIERMPHIHIIIPKMNLVSGNSYDPLIKSHIKYLDAFQECINAKYGLESPKDNLRYTFNSSSEMISRYKGDIFNGHNREVKAQLLEFVLENKPANQIELLQQLNKIGYKVKIRNGNSPEISYLNVMIPGESKGINLKDSVFRNDFLALNDADKVSYLRKSYSTLYRDSQEAGTASDTYQHNLKEWHDWKALEVRYIPEIQAKDRHIYKQLSDEDKVSFLQLKHQQTLNNYLQLIGENNNDEIEQFSLRELTHANRKIGRDSERLEFDSSRIAATEPERVRERIQQLSARSDSGKYRANSELGNADSKSAKQSVIDQVKEEAKREIAGQNQKIHLSELNSLIRADVLLELAEKTHGINPELYFISVDSAGNDRIKCGNRNLNMVDFVVKELNLGLKEATSYMDNVLLMQNDIYRQQSIRQDFKKYLYEEYKEWFANYKNEKGQIMKDLEHNYKNNRQAIMQKYTDTVKAVRENKTLSFTRRQFEVNLAKAQKLIDLDALKKARALDLEQVKRSHNTEMQSAYRIFLTGRAQEGDEVALEELRRLRIKFEPTNHNSIRYVDRYQEYRLNISYEVDLDGTINYKLDDRIIIRDFGKRIDVIDGGSDNLKLSLELAMQKFGNQLTLDGSEEFRMQIVETALKHNFKVEFLDEFSKNYHEKLQQELRIGAESIDDLNNFFMQNTPDRFQYISTQKVDVMTTDGKVKSVSLHTVKDPATNEILQLTNTKLDYLLSKLELDPGLIFDVKLVDNEIKLSQTRESILRREIKREIMSDRLEQFKQDNKQKYGSQEPLSEINGVFIKLDKTKFGKEYAIIKTIDGFTRIDSPELLEKIRLEMPKLGSQVIATVIKQDAEEKEREVAKFRLEKADNYINFDDLLLFADMQTPSLENKKLINEGLGEIMDVREFTNPDGKLYRTTMKTHDGEKKVFYFNDEAKVSVGDFCYVRQATGRNFDVVNLNELKDNQLDNAKKRMLESGVDQVSFGKLLRVGYKEIRGKDVFFAEYQTIEDGIQRTISKYGEAIKDQVFENNLSPGDVIALVKYKETEQYLEYTSTVEFKQLDREIEAEIDAKLEQYYQVKGDLQQAEAESFKEVEEANNLGVEIE